MNRVVRKCKKCQGTGQITMKNIDTNTIYKKECPDCEGSGVPLVTRMEENFHDAATFEGTQTFADNSNYIEIEEEDYEV